jgi:hypothetical protein
MALGFFLKSAFVTCGGFDEKLFTIGSGEDWDIDKLIKKYGDIKLLPQYKELARIPNFCLKKFIEERGVVCSSNYVGIYHNESDFNLLPYLQKKSYYSQGFDGYIKKWGKSDPDIKRQLGLKYRFFTVFMEQGKWKMLLARIDLAIGMYFLRICVGSIYLLKKIRISLASG